MMRTPLSPMSAAMKKRRREYRKIAKDFVEFHSVCMACHRALSTQIHHRAGRNGDRLTATAFWLAVCQPCHSYIHAHPAESREKGWMLDRLEREI